MNNILKKENRIVLVVGIFCLIFIGTIINYTFSFFAVEKTNSSIIAGEAAGLSLTVTVEKVAPTGVSGELIPQLSEYITSAVTGRNGNCIDDNNNPVCEVYKITVKNNSGITIYVDGVVELDAKNNPNLKWAQISGLTTPTVIGNKKTYEETKLTANEIYTGSQQKEYYIVVWISETGLSQTDTGEFNGVVTFYDAEPTSLAATTVYSLGVIPKKDTPKTLFATTSKLEGTTGVYKGEDDLGTSYYYRGNVTNNYVKFGKYTEDAWQVYNSNTGETTYATTCTTSSGITCTQIASSGDDMYWRIVRINGDGTIRIIYDGTGPYENGDANKSVFIGKSAYNINYNDNAYVGYMYGTAESTTYEATHANTNNSTIKTMIDAWYLKYINTNYNSYIADAIYCNDRTRASEEFNTAMGLTGEGYGTYNTGYSLYGRTNLSSEGMPESVEATLKCEQVNDRFTISSSTIETLDGEGTNKKLTYPVGMVTIDEVVYAGGYWYLDDTAINDESYLYAGDQWYWTLSPGGFLSGDACAFRVHRGSIYDLNVDVVYGVRPAISLNSNAIIGGTGTATNPFVVSS